jgi:hypothetical protein
MILIRKHNNYVAELSKTMRLENASTLMVWSHSFCFDTPAGQTTRLLLSSKRIICHINFLHGMTFHFLISLSHWYTHTLITDKLRRYYFDFIFVHKSLTSPVSEKYSDWSEIRQRARHIQCAKERQLHFYFCAHAYVLWYISGETITQTILIYSVSSYPNDCENSI